jgi:hypothetical protein
MRVLRRREGKEANGWTIFETRREERRGEKMRSDELKEAGSTVVGAKYEVMLDSTTV